MSDQAQNAPPLPPSLQTISSPTWAGDEGHTWGGPSVLAVTGYTGEIVTIPRGPAPNLAPRTQLRDAASRFEQLVLLGKGGMGEVWRVRDTDLNRVVAMKIIRLEAGVSEPLYQRFVAEAQATAQLEHPGVVPVYELGRLPDGRIYYTMQEIVGRNLAAVLTDLHQGATPDAFGTPESGWSFPKVIEAFRQVADTIAFAHARGVIHRDLKPANIMLGAYGEVRVVDWGLVKVLDRTGQSEAEIPRGSSPLTLSSGDSGSPHTSAGAIAGTRGYMAPEQALGQIDRLSPASDVYALGGILYAVLAGRAPEDGADRLRLDAPRVPPALREICLHAMAPRPEDRYPDAGALAAAVRGWLEQAAVAEQRRTQSDRVEAAFLALSAAGQAEARELLLRLHGPQGQPMPRPVVDLVGPTLDALLAAGAVQKQNNSVVLCGAEGWDRLAGWLDAERDTLGLRQGLGDVSAVWDQKGRPHDHLWRGAHLTDLEAWRRQRSPRLTRTEQAFADASAAEAERARLRRRAGWGVVLGMLLVGLIGTVALQRRTAAALDQAEAARSAEQAALRLAEGRIYSAESALAEAHANPAEAVALAMAAADRLPQDAGGAERLRWLAASSDPILSFAGHTGALYHGEWLDRDRFVTAGMDRTLRVWDARTGAQLHRMDTVAPAVTIATSPDGQRIAAILENGTFELWSAEDGSRIASAAAHTSFGVWTEFSPDGRTVVTAATEPRVRLWDAQTGAPIRTLDVGANAVSEASFSADSRRLLVSAARPRVYDVDTGALRWEAPDLPGMAHAALSPDGTRVVSVSARGEASAWDLERDEALWSTGPRASNPIPAVVLYSRDGGRVFLGLANGIISGLDADTGAVLRGGGLGHDAGVRMLSGSADGAHFLSFSEDGTVSVWRNNPLTRLSQLRSPGGRVSVARFSPDGRRVLLAAVDGVARVWSPRELQSDALDRCGGLPGEYQITSPDAGWLVFRTTDGLCVRSPQQDTDAGVVPLASGDPLALSGSGDTLITGGEDGALRAWSRSGETRWTWSAPRRPVRAAWSPGGRAVLALLDNQELYFLDAQSGVPLGPAVPDVTLYFLTGLQEAANQALVPTTEADGAVGLYDVETGALRGRLPAGSRNENLYFPLRALPDGRRYLLGDANGWLRLWETGKDAPIWAIQLRDTGLQSLAVSPSGALAAVGSTGEVALIHTEDGRVAWRGALGQVEVNRLVFSPDGATLLSHGIDEVQVLWRVESGAPLWRWRSAAASARSVGCVLQDGSILMGDPTGLRRWEVTTPALGALTNLRACLGTPRVVAVQPFPRSDTVWASEADCDG